MLRDMGLSSARALEKAFHPRGTSLPGYGRAEGDKGFSGLSDGWCAFLSK